VSAVTAKVEILRGRAASTLERIRASERRALAKGAFFVVANIRIELARALAALGSTEEARDLLEAVVAGGVDAGWHYCDALVTLADVLRALGDTGGSEARATEALELGQLRGARCHAASAREVLARLAIGRGEWSRAEGLLHQALVERLEIGVTLWTGPTFDALALVAAGLDSYPEAARLLGAADRARRDLGVVRSPLDAPALADLERRLKDELDAEALAAARHEGAAMPTAEAISWVRRARGTRKRPISGWEALTPTEHQVVDLVVKGLTNPQIAAKMFVSRGTAKIHLEHIFSKLQIHSRFELAALAARRPS
jgi:DNA-binding CsgD family transcriptional regulator